MSYPQALCELQALKTRFAVGQVCQSAGNPIGALAGFALHSEDLSRFAILQADSLELLASAADRIVPTGGFRAAVDQFPAHRKRFVVRHSKGGLYTQVGIVPVDGSLHVLYVSHADRTWWLRPQEMFNDGRFQQEPVFTPLSAAQITQG